MNTPTLCNPLLPIYGKKHDIITALRHSPVIIVSGETGSGKTSQLPLICFEAGYGANGGKIGITQPRRIAATSIAAYVANQCKSQLGSFVGYKVRFSDKESRDTKIKFMTDGIMLRELEHDRLLRGYEAIIIDEAHERSLNIDFLLGYMRTILPKRPALRLIISSATIDTRLFSEAFHEAPVIKVSGRMYPVDIHYKPADEQDDERDDDDADARVDYVSAAAKAVVDIVETQPQGDVLVFMPTEADIIEARQMLETRLAGYCDVLPLFGRMPLSDQQNIFRSHDLQKIVIATNIAETSVTVPGIRYVVDTGLARIKQYDPSLRITRLPIAPISQASARQRAGRSGRVAEGVCIRLYSEEDFLSRQLYTPPEILRANLGQVILSMAALGLGNVEDFPFLEPPPPRAVSQGYASLFELGAIDEEKNLTVLGRDMAILPLDPPLSRMIVEAKKEHCLREILIIASGLCVTDMRVRPLEKKQEADAAHAKFSDPLSDFLFYVKLWDGAEMDRGLSLSQLRKFCKTHFLSFTRMREWRDVHDQLLAIATGRQGPSVAGAGSKTVAFDQLHRCIVAGFLSNIAKKTDDNDYQAAKGRKAFLFPGSSLYKKKPDWIVCAEIVETSRVYARTAASIDPAWCEALGGHLCKRSYSEPSFDEETGTVKAREKVMLFGLAIVENRTVAYGRIDQKIANEIFIRDGLCDFRLQTHHGFFRHNKDLIDRVEQFEKKMRSSAVSGSDELVTEFYLARIPAVTSIHDLNAAIREKGSDSFLHMKESDLISAESGDRAALFPDSVRIGVRDFPIRYEFDPSSMHDGATVEIPSSELACMNESVFDWIVPGFIVQRVQYLLESLPKALKKQFEPVPETSQAISDALSFDGEDFLESLCNAVEALFGVSLDPSQLAIDNLPHHLSTKVVVKRDRGEQTHKSHTSNVPEWNRNAMELEHKNLQAWAMNDVHEKILMVDAKNGFPVYGFPSLVAGKESIDLVVFTSRDDQTANHAKGARALAEKCLEKEMAWLNNDLKFGKHLQMLCTPFAKLEEFKASLMTLLENHCFDHVDFEIRKRSEFEKIITRVKAEFSSEGPKLTMVLEKVLDGIVEFQSMIKRRLTNYNMASYKEIANSIKKEMQKYVTNLLDNKLNYKVFLQQNRYLSAFRYRIDRAFSDMPKYLLKYEIIRPYLEKSDSILSKVHGYSKEKQALIFDFVQMVEEFKISTFAQQEIKTLFPVSQKKVDEKWEEVKRVLKV